MKKILKALAAAALLLTVAACSNIALKDAINKELGITTTRLGSIADRRSGGYGYTLDGYYMESVRSKLLNPANFGPGGTSKKPIVITDIAGTVDSKVLERLDVLMVGRIPNGTLSPGELSAIKSWVQSGGVVVTCPEFDSYNGFYSDDVAAAFGYPLYSGILDPYYGPGWELPAASGLPLFTGPFGDVSTTSAGHLQAGDYSDAGLLGTAAGLTVLSRDDGRVWDPDPSLMAPSIALRDYGKGKLILLMTVDFISDDSLYVYLDDVIDPSYSDEVFLGNLFAYVH